MTTTIRQALAQRDHAQWQAGYDAGYAAAVAEVLDAPMQPEPEPEPALQDQRQVLLAQLEQRHRPASGGLPPYLDSALAFLRDNPGVTAWDARSSAVSSKTAFYRLRDLGLARKDGSRFYACG